MEILSASDAKREFGEVLLKAQHGPVGINKNGKPVAVMVSAAEYAELDSLRTKVLQHEIDIGLADIQAGRVKDGKEVMRRLRKKVRDARL
jgi:prevent-host-death family protein